MADKRAQILREVRLEKKIKQVDLAAEMQWSPSLLSCVETGGKGIPTLPTLKRWGEALKLPRDELVAVVARMLDLIPVEDRDKAV